MTQEIANFIPRRPENQRIWVVRASSGQFINHFLDAGIVAIGHLDDFELQDGSLVISDFSLIKATLSTKYPEKSKGSITSQINQINAFLNAMTIGDLVITLNSNALIMGRIVSEAYVANEPIVRINKRNKKHVMKHRVRRSVTWGPTLRRSALPSAVEVTLFAHQTVFNMDDHWQIIYHLLYPFFAYEDNLYLSTNIRQSKAIDNYSVSQMFSLLSGIEAIARTLEADSKTDLDYLAIYSNFAANHLFTLTSKAEFMSPGSIWSKISLTPKGMAILCVAYAMLFGADVAGMKTDGIIDKEIRHKIFELIIQMKEQHDMESLNNKLKPSLPKNKTTPLEDSSVDQVKIA